MARRYVTALDVGAAPANHNHDDRYILSIDRAASNGVAPLVNGVIPQTYLPQVAISKPFPCTSEVEMLSLIAEAGDVAIRSDLNRSFMLFEEPASDIGNWVELLTPPDAVLAVNGMTGSVNLGPNEVGAAPIAHVGSGGAAHSLATEEIAGFMSPTDKQLLAAMSSSGDTPIGSGRAWFSPNDPTDPTWMIADGRAISRSTYDEAFAVMTFQRTVTRTNGSTTLSGFSSTANIAVGSAVEGTGIQSATVVAAIPSSTTVTLSKTATSSGTSALRFLPFGGGNGSSTFNIPNAGDRALIGANPVAGGGFSRRAVGEMGGAETHTLSINELPEHDHSIRGDSVSNTTGGGSAPRINNLSNWPSGNNTGTSAPSGGSQPHSNMQPFLVVSWIVKVGS